MKEKFECVDVIDMMGCIVEARTAIEGAEMSIPKNLMFDAESAEFKPETKPVTASRAKGLTVEEAKTPSSEKKVIWLHLLF